MLQWFRCLAQISALSVCLVFCTKTICFVFTFRAYYGIQHSSIHLVHIIFQPCSILTTNFSLKQNRENGCFKKKKSIFFLSQNIWKESGMFNSNFGLTGLNHTFWGVIFNKAIMSLLYCMSGLGEGCWMTEENLKHWENAKRAVSLDYFSKKANSDPGLYLTFNTWRH